MQQNFSINEQKTTFKSIISKSFGKSKNLQINSNDTIKEQVQNNQKNSPFKSNFTEKNIIKESGDENDNNISNIFLNKNYEIENFDNEKQFHTGRWTEEEHQKFIDGILQYGNEWKKVQQVIRTRSSTQARSHAQKFFLKIKKIIQNNNVNFNDKEKIVEIIANNIYSNINEKRNSLTKVQKEKLLNVIFSNIKYDEKNKEYNDEENEEIGLEEDNLGYEKQKEKNNDLLPKNYHVDEIISGNLENKKIGLKRKLSRNFEMKDIDKIFSIQKDLSHRASMDFSISKLSNTEEKRYNSFNSLRNNINQDNKNFENNNLNNLNNNSQNNSDNNFDNKNNKNNYIIHNYINVTNNYMNNNYIYNIYNPDTFNNIYNNNNINGIQDSFNINYDKNDSYNNERNQNQNYYANWQNSNKFNYNSNSNLEKNISNINGINRLNNFNDYDNNNNDPFKLEFGIFPDKNNNNENEHQFSINEEEFMKSSNNNEDNGSIL